ncbi:MAG: Crp/Fnr family transcriptional regulator [Saprospiraceae bacterium]|nr:Crp/Fnr family transcriptional regulator [Saprospiraceae bacterium]MDW8228404.1 Crp/Fnr family transcriptional regulator [Saprospiraceae bacterium]
MDYAAILKETFDPVFCAPLEAWQQFAGACRPVLIRKDETIKHPGAAERALYFILSGSAGLFLWKEGHSVCLDFAFDRQFCADYMSLLTGQPTPLEVVALEKSEMLRLSAADFHALTHKTVGHMIRLVAAETSFVDKQQQQIELLTLTAAERYARLQERFPGIAHRIAQKHIASYLGITPQSLSRIRREAAKRR